MIACERKASAQFCNQCVSSSVLLPTRRCQLYRTLSAARAKEDDSESLSEATDDDCAVSQNAPLRTGTDSKFILHTDNSQVIGLSFRAV